MVQADEFHIEYREFELANGSWTPSKTIKVCQLNGSLAMALKEAALDTFGSATVRFGTKLQPRDTKQQIDSDRAVIEKAYAQDETDITEKFKLEDVHFRETTGVLNPLRSGKSANDSPPR